MINNIHDLTKVLCDTLEKVQGDQGQVKQAAEVSRVAGRILGAQKLLLDYHAQRDEAPNLKFMRIGK